MSRSFLVRLLVAFVICLSSLGGGTVAAQDVDPGSVSATRSCSELLIVRWEPTYYSVRFSATNTSTDWTTGWQEVEHPIFGFETFEVGQAFDKVLVEVQGPSGQPISLSFNVGTCMENPAIPSHPADMNQSVYYCGFRTQTGLEKTFSNSLLTLYYYYGAVTISDSGDIAFVGPHANQIYLGECDGRTLTPEGIQPVDWPDSPVVFCDNGTTATAEAGTFNPGFHMVMEGKGTWEPQFRNAWIDWSEVEFGKTQGPCIDTGDEDNGETPAQHRSLQGTVVDEHGKPLAGVFVCYSYQLSWDCTTTNADGYYSLTDLFLSYRFEVLSHDPNWSFGSGMQLDWDDNLTFDFTAVPHNPDGDLWPYFGQIVDKNGNPINDFRVCSSAGKGGICFVSNGTSNQFRTVGPGANEFVSISSAGCPDLHFIPESGWDASFDLGSVVLDCETGVPPSTDPSPTPDTDDDQEDVTDDGEIGSDGEGTMGTTITVQVLLNGDASVESAPFGVYAPEASTLPTGAFFTGIVGANNTMTVPDIIPGMYNMAIAPEDGDLIEFSIIVEEDSTAIIVDLRVDGDGQTSGTTPAKAQSSGSKVDSLPTTGSGYDSSAASIWLATVAIVSLAAGALLIRRNRA